MKMIGEFCNKSGNFDITLKVGTSGKERGYEKCNSFDFDGVIDFIGL